MTTDVNTIYVNYIKSVILYTMAFFSPVWSNILLVTLFILMDTITGILASRKLGESIRLERFKDIFYKIILYHTCMLIGFMTDILLIGEFLIQVFSIELLLTKLISLTIIFTEAASINNNIFKITNKSPFEMFTDMLKKVDTLKNSTDKIKRR
jgi:small neutral amino acid transporter SnatA (MarC family)